MGDKAWSEMSLAARKKAKKKLAQHMRDNPTPSEKALLDIARKTALEALWKPQVIANGYIIDVASDRFKIALEADGGYHNQEEQKAHDEVRDHALNQSGWEVLRFSNEEIASSPARVVVAIKDIVARVKEKRPRCAKRGNRKSTIMAEALHAVVARGCPECASIAADALRECGY